MIVARCDWQKATGTSEGWEASAAAQVSCGLMYCRSSWSEALTASLARSLLMTKLCSSSDVMDELIT